MASEMKALTICQPYPEMILLLLKQAENRTWCTSYRGPLWIHAGKSREWLDEGDEEAYPGMVFGAIVGSADLVACLPKRSAEDRRMWHPTVVHLFDDEHVNGPWCWILENVRRLKAPIPCRGAQGLWIPEPRVVDLVLADEGVAV